MSKRENEIKQATEKAETIKISLSVDEAKTEITKELAGKIKELVSEEEFDTDSTEGRISNKIKEFFEQISEEFKELVEKKKRQEKVC